MPCKADGICGSWHVARRQDHFARRILVYTAVRSLSKAVEPGYIMRVTAVIVAVITTFEHGSNASTRIDKSTTAG